MTHKWMIAGGVGLLSMFITTLGGVLLFVSGIKVPEEVPAKAAAEKPSAPAPRPGGMFDEEAREEIMNVVPEGRRSWSSGAPERTPRGTRYIPAPSMGGSSGG